MNTRTILMLLLIIMRIVLLIAGMYILYIVDWHIFVGVALILWSERIYIDTIVERIRKNVQTRV